MREAAQLALAAAKLRQRQIKRTKAKARKAVPADDAAALGVEEDTSRAGVAVEESAPQPAVTTAPVRQLQLVDTGCTTTLLGMSLGRIWGCSGTKQLRARDAQGGTLLATGGGPLYAQLATVQGTIVELLIAGEAFVSKTLDESLISMPALRRLGWAMYAPSGCPPFLVSPTATGGHVIPLSEDKDGHFWLSLEVVPSKDGAHKGAVSGTPGGRSAPARPKTLHLAASASTRGETVVTEGLGRDLTSAVPADGEGLASAPAASGAPGGVSVPARPKTPHLADGVTEGLGRDATAALPACGEGAVSSTLPPSEPARAATVLRSGGAGTPATWPSKLDESARPAPSGHTPDGAWSPTAEDDKAASAAARLKQRHVQYAFHHAAYNHQSFAVDAAIQAGLLPDAEKPPGFSCAECARADPSGAHWQRHTKASPSSPLVPYHTVEMDIWGPLDVGDRNGFRYMYGAVCRASGKGYLQPLRAKSEATHALRKYLALIREQCPGIEVHLRSAARYRDITVPGLAVVCTDRGGEFTTTHGYTESEFDAMLADVVHRLNTPDTPQSGTSRIERLWRSLSTAARSSLLSSGLGMQYFFDAMVMASDVRNVLPTSANRLGDGEAPDATLGLQYDLKSIVPLGTLGYLLVDGKKADPKNVLVVIIGFNNDGPGYRAVRVDNGTVVASVHIKPDPRQPRCNLPGLLGTSSAAASDFVREHYDLSDSSRTFDLGTAMPGQITDLADEPAAPTPPGLVQQVGAAPGNGGSRAGLRRRAGPAQAAEVSGGLLHDTSTVQVMIRDTRAAGQVLRWRPGFSKTGRSGERYPFYSKARTFAQFDALTKEMYLSGLTGTQRPKAVTSDMSFDVAREILTFCDADTPVGTAPTFPAPAADGSLSDDASEGETPAVGASGASSDAPDIDDEEDDDASAIPGAGRYLLRPRHRACAVTTSPALTPAERALLLRGRADATAYIAVPDTIIRAAVRRHDTGRMRIPRSIAEAQHSPEWKLWLAALQAEYGGLVKEGVFDEVDESTVPASTKVVPTQVLFSIKANGTYKCRIVVRGDLTVKGDHYLETKSSMATLESIRMLVALAAGSDRPLYSTDFSQAFINADSDNPHLYCKLPLLPPEMRGGEYGMGGHRGKVGHLKKALYGLPHAPRLWQQHLMRFLTDELGARLFTHDRNVFEWDWEGETLHGAIHVDDILFSVSSLTIRDEFMRRLKAKYRVTGGEEEATEFCGIQIVRDWAKHTVTLTQETFARAMLAKYDVGGKGEATPFKTKAKLEPYEGDECEETAFDYSMALGDLAWYSRTNPGLSFAVHKLAQFMQRPGPDHVAAVHHVFHYIKAHLDAGLTYHGCSAVLTQSYDHRNKLIGTFDSDFPHTGSKATSEIAVLLNGAAILWKTRRQTTVSITSTEAEVKAMEPGVQSLRWLTGLVGEFLRTKHGSVRVLDDSSGGISQVVSGMDSAKCASYKKAHAYAEDAVDNGIMWLDHVPGKHNPSDLLTKQVGNIEEFGDKNGVMIGSKPFLYESTAVLDILNAARNQNVSS